MTASFVSDCLTADTVRSHLSNSLTGTCGHCADCHNVGGHGFAAFRLAGFATTDTKDQIIADALNELPVSFPPADRHSRNTRTAIY